MISQYKIVLRLEEQALGACGAHRWAQASAGRAGAGRAGRAQARGAGGAGGSDSRVARCRGGAAGTGERGARRVGLAGRSRRGLGALLANGLCTWCTQPVFGPV